MRLPPARRRWASLLVLVALTACSAPGPAPRPEAPLPTPTSTVGRPLLAIPDVRPAGFADPPPGSGLARYEAQPVDWQPCGAPALCATVRVPLDYAQPDGTAITLALAKIPATAPVRRGALFLDPGGPGGSGFDFVRGFRPAGLEAFDLVGWDPRGVGRSTPVTCSADLDRFNSIDVSPDTPAEKSELLTESRAFGASCLARSGILLEHISTAETVTDLDLLRRLVGQDKLDYLGFSYGTLLGSLYAQRYPQNVGRLVLDGATDITGQGAVSQISGFERALNHFATWCAGQACGLGANRDEVVATVSTLLRDLDQRPLKVGRRELSQQQGVQAVINAMYGGVRGWTELGPELRQAVAGDGRSLLAHADRANERTGNGRYGQIAYAFPAIRCRDSNDVDVAEAERESVEANRQAPILGPLNGPDVLCTQWPVAPGPRSPKITAAGAPTIVVVGTTGDPATPYEWAVSMSKQLDAAVLVTFEGEGHTAYGQSRCVQARVQDFLLNGVLPEAGTRC